MPNAARPAPHSSAEPEKKVKTTVFMAGRIHKLVKHAAVEAETSLSDFVERAMEKLLAQPLKK